MLTALVLLLPAVIASAVVDRPEVVLFWGPVLWVLAAGLVIGAVGGVLCVSVALLLPRRVRATRSRLLLVLTVPGLVICGFAYPLLDVPLLSLTTFVWVVASLVGTVAGAALVTAQGTVSAPRADAPTAGTSSGAAASVGG